MSGCGVDDAAVNRPSIVSERWASTVDTCLRHELVLVLRLRLEHELALADGLRGFNSGLFIGVAGALRSGLGDLVSRRGLSWYVLVALEVVGVVNWVDRGALLPV